MYTQLLHLISGELRIADGEIIVWRAVSMAASFNESVVEEAAPEWLAGTVYAVAHGPEIIDLPPYRPSEVLFNVDQEAYRDLLAGYVADGAEPPLAEEQQ